MSMGSDFNQGYGLGLNTRQMDKAPEYNPWSYLAGNAQNISNEKIAMMRVGGGGGGGMSAKKILENARIEALKEKEMELNNQAKEIANAEQEIRNRAAARKESDDYIARADERARGLATDRYTSEDRAKANSAEQAIRGFYAKDPESIINFINQNGSSDANAIDVQWGTGQEGLDDAGKVYIKFSDGRTAVYANDKDAIEKVIAPMAILQQDIKGRMTEAQQAESDINQYKAENERQKGLDTRSREWGKQNYKKPFTNSEKITLRNSLAKELDRQPTEEELNIEIAKIEGRKNAPNMGGRRGTPSEAGYGLNTGGTNTVTESEVRATAKDRGWSKEKTEKYIKDGKANGKIKSDSKKDNDDSDSDSESSED